MAGFCLRALLPLKHPKIKNPTTVCQARQYREVPGIPSPTPKSTVL